jgi:hypothetical protein
MDETPLSMLHRYDIHRYDIATAKLCSVLRAFIHAPPEGVKSPPGSRCEAARAPKVLLKADREAGMIVLDSETQLSGIPPSAWTYVLGNRSALDWVLDQHKERAPKDPTVRARFNMYRFADHKERVVDLLGRVTRVSVETAAIVEAMRALPR